MENPFSKAFFLFFPFCLMTFLSFSLSLPLPPSLFLIDLASSTFTKTPGTCISKTLDHKNFIWLEVRCNFAGGEMIQKYKAQGW